MQTYGKDLLVVLSDSGKLSFLTFSVEMHRFFFSFVDYLLLFSKQKDISGAS
jgi:hypothetical protein